jgi:phosphopantothenoylcysteine decarboxylase/phosphopantothenate--cysteine ligase
VISQLVQDGHDVQTVVSRGALEFIGRATLEGLTGKRVLSDLYEEGRMMDHIHLSKWADLAILCPASANTINRLAAGLADDPIGALFLSFDFKKPYLLAPAMNHQMFKHPATQTALGKLESYGVKVLPTGEGHQACGDVGEGRLLEPDQILEAIRKCLG